MIFLQVMKLVAPITSVKKLKSELTLDGDLPEFVVGDEKRLMQTVLNVVGNAVKFTKEGSVTIHVILDRDRTDYQRSEPHSLREPLSQVESRSQRDHHLSLGEQHCYIRVEVQKFWS